MFTQASSLIILHRVQGILLSLDIAAKYRNAPCTDHAVDTTVNIESRNNDELLLATTVLLKGDYKETRVFMPK